MELNKQLQIAIETLVPDIQARNTSMMLDGVFTGLINYKNNEPSLQDLLLAISKTGYKHSDYDIEKCILKIWDYYNENDCRKVELDLTKSLFQWSDETKVALLELLK